MQYEKTTKRTKSQKKKGAPQRSLIAVLQHEFQNLNGLNNTSLSKSTILFHEIHNARQDTKDDFDPAEIGEGDTHEGDEHETGVQENKHERRVEQKKDAFLAKEFNL